ncbi:MAG: CDC27 family protein [Candidatus Hodarchaeales archaeon]
MSPRITEPKDPLKIVHSGVFALKRKKWNKAKRKFEEALKYEDFQDNAGLWANYGISLINLKQFSDALAAFSRAVELDNKNAELWIKKGLIEYQLNLLKEAEKSLIQAQRRDKLNPETPILLSRIYSKQGNISKQIKTLENAWKKHSDSVKIPIELARALYKDEKPDKVEKVLNKALKQAKSADPGLVLGQYFLDEKEYDRALEVYNKVLDRFPNSYYAAYGIGVAYHAKNKWSNALESYKKAAIMFRPNKPPQSLYVNMSRVLKQLGKYKEAIDTLYKAKKLGKTTIEISLLLAELFLENKRPDRALRALEDAKNLDKNNPTIPFYIGLTLLELKEKERAKEEFKRSLILDPQFYESKLQLALLLTEEKQWNEAYRLSSDVVKINPNHTAARRLAAKLAFDLHKFKESIEYIKPVVIEKTQLDDLELLLRSWVMRNEPDKAKQFMKSEISLNEDLKDQMRSKIFLRQFI